MRSIFLVLAFGAVARASEECADESTLLQGGIRGRKVKKHSDANSVLESLKTVANSMVEGSTTTMRRTDVDDAVQNANDALATLSPAIRDQVQQSQQQINDAAAAVEFCHGEDLAETRNFLANQAETRAAENDACQAQLQTLTADAERQCNIAQDCLCDEAVVRRDDKAELCAVTQALWETAFCEHNLACTTFVNCHSNEKLVYDTLQADVQTEMNTVELEYIAAEQSSCLMLLIQTSLLAGQPIDAVAMLACNNVDTSAIQITYPDMPAEPEACPVADHECRSLEMITNWNFEGMTANGVPQTLLDGRWIHFTNNGNSGLTNPEILGWQYAGNGGVNGIFNPANNVVAEGTHVLFLNRGSDTDYVWQNLLHPFTADLHIEAAVGGGNGVSDGGYRMGLYTQDGTLVKEVAAGVDGAPNTSGERRADGSYPRYVLTRLDVTTAANGAYVGQTLQIRLKKNKGGQGHYHYVRFL